MTRRNQRPLMEEKVRRGSDRRQTVRRKSDIMATLFKYLMIAALTAIVLEVIRR